MNKIHHQHMLKKTSQSINLFGLFPACLVFHYESQSCRLRVIKLSSTHAFFVTCLFEFPLFFLSILVYTLALKSTT
jgi:hypothetical protein